jgi:hypothetical protein
LIKNQAEDLSPPKGSQETSIGVKPDAPKAMIVLLIARVRKRRQMAQHLSIKRNVPLTRKELNKKIPLIKKMMISILELRYLPPIKQVQ